MPGTATACDRGYIDLCKTESSLRVARQHCPIYGLMARPYFICKAKSISISLPGSSKAKKCFPSTSVADYFDHGIRSARLPIATYIADDMKEVRFL